MTALRIRQSPYGRRAWTIDTDGALDLDAAAANATTEEAFAMAGLRLQSFDLALWARQEVAPAGAFFSHTRRTADDAFVVGTANSTAAPVDPGAQAVSLGPIYGGLHRAAPSGPFAISSAGSGVSAAGNVAANASALRALTAAVVAGAGNVLVASPRLALPAGFALDQGAVNVGGDGLIGIHNLTAAPADPATPRWDWVILQRFVSDSSGGALDVLRPRVSGSGQFFIRRFRVSIEFSAGIAAEAVGEASAVVAPRTPILVSDETLSRISVALANPTAALPAGFAVSHARISAENTLTVGLANVSGAGPTAPGTVEFDIYVFTPPSR